MNDKDKELRLKCMEMAMSFKASYALKEPSIVDVIRCADVIYGYVTLEAREEDEE